MITWDEIDAHSTGGVAEEAVQLLNSGCDETSVCRVLHISLSTLEYIICHEEYSVLPEDVRTAKAQEDWDFRQSVYRIEKLMRAIRKAGRGQQTEL